LEQEAAWIQFVSEVEAFLGAPTTAVTPDQKLHLQGLTLREREVLELVAQGLDNVRIAEKLGIGGKTVRNHVSSVLGKLGLQRSPEAIVRAREAGFGRKLA